MFWRALTHHSLKTVLRLVQLLVFVVLPGALFWLHFAGLPRALHEPLVEAARREGLLVRKSQSILEIPSAPTATSKAAKTQRGMMMANRLAPKRVRSPR